MKRHLWILAAVGAWTSFWIGEAGARQEQPAPTPAPAPAPAPPAPPSSDPPAPRPPAPTPAPAPEPPEKEPAPAEDIGPEIVVYLKDGRSLTGILVRENREEVVIRISGIETPIGTSTIDRYQILPPILERYRQFRISIGDDPDQIATLVSWLQAREQLALAKEEVDRLLKIDPHHKQGLALKKAVESQIELRAAARSRVAEGTERAAAAPVRDMARATAGREPFPLLSDDQINLIKVFEIDMANPPRILISRETIGKMLRNYAGSALLPPTQEGRDAIYRRPPLEVLDLMFRLKARELYGEVRVLDHPRALRVFRDDVQAGWLVNSCATADCHGGADAGRLMLVNRKARSEVSTYTNFLILERFRLSDGTALLNYEEPAKSPLLQMALPRQDSLSPHPVVGRGARGNDVWRPLFRNTQDRGFERAVEWLKRMYRPRPEYPIEYQPPRPSEAPEAEKEEPRPR